MLVSYLCLFTAYATHTVQAAAFARNAAGPRCSDVSTSVTVSATVRQFPSSFNRTTFNYSTAPDLPGTQASGTYQIAASYCEPGTVDPTRHATLQILVHGISYTRTYWSGLGHPPESFASASNSWIDYASDQGYPTLAIDRLCNGNSTHPNGTLACQAENQVEILKAIVDEAKNGRYGGRSFTSIILVGHSYGSVLIEAFTQSFPSDVHSVVHTGFSSEVERTISVQARTGGFYGPSASQINPELFGSLDSNYMLVKPESVFVGSFFAGSFNKTVAQFNFNTSGTFNLFELATIRIGQLTASGYHGSVIALNGELDAVACGTPSGSGNCGDGSTSPTQQVSALYPNAKRFFAYNTANTGHCLNLHASSTESFHVIFDELSQQGL